MKDINGQFIYYYSVSPLLTQIHDVYDEAIEKIFNLPIKLDCLVGQPEREQPVNKWGIETAAKVEVLIQARDLIDKEIELVTGDFFIYGEEVFEVLNVIQIGDIFGQAEYNVYWKMTAKSVRSGRFDIDTFKKLLEDKKSFKDSNVNKTFEQQRGLPETDNNGATGDVRQVRERLKENMADIALNEGPRVVKTNDEDVSDTTGEESSNSFYNE